MSYAYDQVLEPASDILTEPIDDDGFGVGKGLCEAESLQFFFSYLDLRAGVRYRVNKRDDFLALDWVRHRLKDDLIDGQSYPSEEQSVDVTQYTVDQVTELLGRLGLEPCADGDDDRVVLIWTIGDEPDSRVGHIQIRYSSDDDDTWESKVARTPWVITHAELDFQYYKGQLVRSRYFKRATP